MKLTAFEGEQVEVVGNSSGHGYVTGQKVIVKNIDKSKMPEQYHCSDEFNKTYWLDKSDFKLLCRTREQLLSQLVDCESEIKLIKEKLQYLDSYEKDVFYEKEYLLSKGLSIVNSTEDEKERAESMERLLESFNIF